MASQRESDLQQLAIKSKSKEALMIEEFTEEKNDIGAQCEQKLKAANERWNSRPSLLKDLETIKSL